MSWICPYCSHSNEETRDRCFVCEAERPRIIIPKGKIFFSDFEAFVDSLDYIFGEKEPETPGRAKSTKIAEGHPDEREKKKTTILKNSFDEPWPEHKIKLDIDYIKGQGYDGMERTTVNGVKGYNFLKKDGSTQFIRKEMLLLSKMAIKI